MRRFSSSLASIVMHSRPVDSMPTFEACTEVWYVLVHAATLQPDLIIRIPPRLWAAESFVEDERTDPFRTPDDNSVA